MFLRCIRAENRKLHASPIWFLFFLLPVLSAAYGTVNYLGNLGILSVSWYALWTQHTLFYSLFFFPAMVAIYASYLWRLEHLGHNWNLIMAVPVHYTIFRSRTIRLTVSTTERTAHMMVTSPAKQPTKTRTALRAWAAMPGTTPT